MGGRVGGDEVAVVGDMVGEKCAKPLDIVAPVEVIAAPLGGAAALIHRPLPEARARLACHGANMQDHEREER